MNKPLLFFLGYIFLVNNIFPMNQSPAQEQFTVANLVALQKSDPAAGWVIPNNPSSAEFEDVDGGSEIRPKNSIEAVDYAIGMIRICLQQSGKSGDLNVAELDVCELTKAFIMSVNFHGAPCFNLSLDRLEALKQSFLCTVNLLKSGWLVDKQDGSSQESFRSGYPEKYYVLSGRNNIVNQEILTNCLLRKFGFKESDSICKDSQLLIKKDIWPRFQIIFGLNVNPAIVH